MPDNPVVPDLLTHAAKAVTAQAELRNAMAAVAREITATPAPSPPPAKPA